jgi:hypothetical protein
LHIIVLGLKIKSQLAYHTAQQKEIEKGGEAMRNGKKPTRKQKVRLGQVGLSPENWLVIRQKPDGELIILHKHTNKVRVVPAPTA